MATTLGTARAALRRRLEDSTATPLWSDALLLDAFTAALAEYSQWSRQQLVTSFVATAAQTSWPLPAGAREVVRVTGAGGFIIPRAVDGLRKTSDAELGWEMWGGTLYFTSGLSAGTYTVWYTADWLAPVADTDALGIPDADVPLLYALAAVVALDERAVQEWKRGQLPPRYQTALSEARLAAAAEWHARRRRLRVAAATGG